MQESSGPFTLTLSPGARKRGRTCRMTTIAVPRIVWLVLAECLIAARPAVADEGRPNVVVILCDDLGYGIAL